MGTLPPTRVIIVLPHVPANRCGPPSVGVLIDMDLAQGQIDGLQRIGGSRCAGGDKRTFGRSNGMSGRPTKTTVMQKHSTPGGRQLPLNDPTADSLRRLGQRFERGVGGTQRN